jgi:hypothetical protein
MFHNDFFGPINLCLARVDAAPCALTPSRQRSSSIEKDRIIYESLVLHCIFSEINDQVNRGNLVNSSIGLVERTLIQRFFDKTSPCLSPEYPVALKPQRSAAWKLRISRRRSIALRPRYKI